jgi:hypothetical protein
MNTATLQHRQNGPLGALALLIALASGCASTGTAIDAAMNDAAQLVGAAAEPVFAASAPCDRLCAYGHVLPTLCSYRKTNVSVVVE